MFCKKCGYVIPESAGFCPKCGAKIDTMSQGRPAMTVNQPARQDPFPAQPVYGTPFITPQQQQEANSILIWGILGLAFSCTFFLSFLGIIFSSIAKGKVRDYIARYGVLYGKAKVGNILSTVGIPVGIVMTVLLAIYIIYIIVLAAAIGSYYYYY